MDQRDYSATTITEERATERESASVSASAEPASTVDSLSNPIHVLHVVNLPKANSAYYFKNIFDYTDRLGIKSSVVTLGVSEGFTEELEQRGTTAYALGCPGRRHYPRTVNQLSRLIESEKVDIVHTHNFDPSLIGFVAARRSRRRLIVTRHHSVAIHLIPQRLKREGYLFAERMIHRYASCIIAPSMMVRDILIEREGLPPAKVTVIPYGQTTERFDAVTPERVESVRSELGMAEQLSLVYVARLDPGKGHSYLFEAFAGLVGQGVEAKLYLVGAGPMEDKLKALATRLGIEDEVRFLGWRADALTVMAGADIAVHPSLHEALSQTVIEAVVLERPLIATDVSGVRDTIGDNEFGMIVPPADAEALRLALERTINDLEGARERARLGRRFVLDYMDAERAARGHVDCYKRVFGGQRPA